MLLGSVIRELATLDSLGQRNEVGLLKIGRMGLLGWEYVTGGGLEGYSLPNKGYLKYDRTREVACRHTNGTPGLEKNGQGRGQGQHEDLNN